MPAECLALLLLLTTPRAARARPYETASARPATATRALAENIAKGPFTPDETVHRWLDSPGHRRNILHRGAAETGLGVAYGENQNGFEVLWMQVFADR